MKYKNQIGKKYGKLLILEEDKNINKRGTYYKCQCDCGNIKSLLGFNVINGRTKSCGCITKEINKYNAPNTKHKLSKTRIYKIWSKMKNRCNNDKYFQYYLYGGRGIKVCEEWSNKKDGFINFYNWAIKNGYEKHLQKFGNKNTTIDRIDVNGNYEPSNCKWSTQKEQSLNKTNNRLIKYNNEEHTISEWAIIKNLTKSTIYHRLERGWSVEKTLTTPLKK